MGENDAGTTVDVAAVVVGAGWVMMVIMVDSFGLLQFWGREILPQL